MKVKVNQIVKILGIQESKKGNKYYVGLAGMETVNIFPPKGFDADPSIVGKEITVKATVTTEFLFME